MIELYLLIGPRWGGTSIAPLNHKTRLSVRPAPVSQPQVAKTIPRIRVVASTATSSIPIARWRKKKARQTCSNVLRASKRKTRSISEDLYSSGRDHSCSGVAIAVADKKEERFAQPDFQASRIQPPLFGERGIKNALIHYFHRHKPASPCTNRESTTDPAWLKVKAGLSYRPRGDRRSRNCLSDRLAHRCKRLIFISGRHRFRIRSRSGVENASHAGPGLSQFEKRYSKLGLATELASFATIVRKSVNCQPHHRSRPSMSQVVRVGSFVFGSHDLAELKGVRQSSAIRLLLILQHDE
jgi:hypothetical protein